MLLAPRRGREEWTMIRLHGREFELETSRAATPENSLRATLAKGTGLHWYAGRLRALYSKQNHGGMDGGCAAFSTMALWTRY